jgi:hypothetical protein
MYLLRDDYNPQVRLKVNGFDQLPRFICKVWKHMSMNSKLFLLVSVSTCALVGNAVAGQPFQLSDAQMDRVVAGAAGSAIGLADALGNLEAQTVTLTLGSAGQGTALAIGLSAASASSLLSPAAASSRSAAVARAP